MDTENSALIESIVSDFCHAIFKDDGVDIGFAGIPWRRITVRVIRDRPVTGDGQHSFAGQCPGKTPDRSVLIQYFVLRIIFLITIGIACDPMTGV